MKLHKLICLATTSFVIWPPAPLNAGCGVSCSNAYIAPAFIATQYAVPVGVPVAAPYAATYTYSPQPQPVNVTVNLDAHAIASEVVNALTAIPANQPTPAPDGPPLPPQQPPTSRLKQTPVPRAAEDPFAEPQTPQPVADALQRCVVCHSAQGKQKAFARFDPLNPNLPCEIKLKACNDIVTERMPPPNDPLGGKLTPDEAGKLITKFSK